MKKFDISRKDHHDHEKNKYKFKRANTIHREPQRAEHYRYIRRLFSNVETILCIGSRHDSEVQFFINNGYEALGVDIAGEETKLIKTIDAHNMMDVFHENQFDIVYSSHSMEHMHDAEAVLKNIRKVALQGCFIVLPPKSGLGMSHCSVFDIMCEAEVGNISDDGWPDYMTESQESLRDFKPLMPADFIFYKNMDYDIKKEKFREFGLAFSWEHI